VLGVGPRPATGSHRGVLPARPMVPAVEPEHFADVGRGGRANSRFDHQRARQAHVQLRRLPAELRTMRVVPARAGGRARERIRLRCARFDRLQRDARDPVLTPRHVDAVPVHRRGNRQAVLHDDLHALALPGPKPESLRILVRGPYFPHESYGVLVGRLALEQDALPDPAVVTMARLCTWRTDEDELLVVERFPERGKARHHIDGKIVGESPPGGTVLDGLLDELASPVEEVRRARNQRRLPIEDGDVVVDLGANVGNFSNLAISHGPKIKGFVITSDELERDNENEIIYLKGNVKVVYKTQYFEADTITLDLRKKQAHLVGNVKVQSLTHQLGGHELILDYEA